MLGSAIRKNGSALLGVPLREAVAIAVSVSVGITVTVSVGIAVTVTVAVTFAVTIAVSGPGDGSYGCRADAGRDVGAAAATVV